MNSISIIKICKHFNITNYSINDDYSINVDGDVVLSNFKIKYIPLTFNLVTGSFHCHSNKLVSFINAPKIVVGDISFHNNRFNNFDSFPLSMGNKNLYCNSNKLTTLNGIPENFEGSLYCANNPIHEIYSLFSNYKSYLKAMEWKFLNGTEIHKRRFSDALEEQSLIHKMPLKFNNYKYK